MDNKVHILNGDALKHQLSDIPPTNYIILRETFIEGPLDQHEFFKNRALYLSEKYDTTPEEYAAKGEAELSKIKNLSIDQEIVLWFEYDLFCQCNFWYVCHEINKMKGSPTVSWVHPVHDSWSGFGKMDKQELENIYTQRQVMTLKEVEIFASIWTLYQKGLTQQIIETAKLLKENYPKLESTIKAHKNRMDPSFLLNISKQYLEELKVVDFISFYTKFQQEQGIYGFGDLQVKELYQQMKKNLDTNQK